jgi:hypothetical protein
MINVGLVYFLILLLTYIPLFHPPIINDIIHPNVLIFGTRLYRFQVSTRPPQFSSSASSPADSGTETPPPPPPPISRITLNEMTFMVENIGGDVIRRITLWEMHLNGDLLFKNPSTVVFR